jgi:signal transduction histidine kinase
LAGPKSVEWRILLRLLPLLVVILLVSLFWLGRHLTGALHASHLEAVRRSNQAIVSTIQAAMITEGGHGVWDRIADRIADLEGPSVTVVNSGGEVLLSTDSVERKITRTLHQSPCRGCHVNGALRPAVESAVLDGPGDKSLQFLAAPLRNSVECRACHREDGQKLGVVLVGQSLQPIDERLSSVKAALAAVGGFVLLGTMLASRSLLRRHLGRPLERLVAGAEAIDGGDLHHTIEAPESRELGVLADTLNKSAARLLRLGRELKENERLAEIGQTVAGLSHVLKNVLNGLRAGQYVLDRALEKDDQEKLRKGLHVTKSSVRRVERLIFDMLYYAKERVPRREPVDPNEVIAEVADQLKDLAESLGVELRTEIDEGIGAVALDRTGIFRAIVDLVTNAIDACTESESGDLVILKSRGRPDEIVLTVEDNGIGMTEEVLSKVYSRFFSTKAAGGTGLGLHVVKKITEEHGGTVEVDSVPDAGSAFHLHLPRSDETVAGPVEDNHAMRREVDAPG